MIASGEKITVYTHTCAVLYGYAGASRYDDTEAFWWHRRMGVDLAASAPTGSLHYVDEGIIWERGWTDGVALTAAALLVHPPPAGP